jgi:hypothetical protein
MEIVRIGAYLTRKTLKSPSGGNMLGRQHSICSWEVPVGPVLRNKRSGDYGELGQPQDGPLIE